jgi:hypothetical protein
MRTTKKILISFFVIIVFIIFSIFLKVVIAGYQPPFGGEYTNLCGSGYTADKYQCDAECYIDSGKCHANSGEWIYVFVCDGRLLECKTGLSWKFQPGGSARVLDFATPGSNKTVQIDVFNKECDKYGSWDCLGNPPRELLGYIVWYSGQSSPTCSNGECSSPGSKICVDLNSYRECRWDSAVGKNCWSNRISCPSSYICKEGECVPKPEVSVQEFCNFKGTFSANPSSGNLASRFNITYGVTRDGTCDTCSGTLNVTLNLDNIRKDWGGTKNQSFTHSFTTGISGGSKTVTFEPQYHGNQNFSVNVSGNVSCDSIRRELEDRIEIVEVTPNYESGSGSVLVNPTDVIALNVTITSSPPTPPSGTYKTPLRQFIAGFEHIITYGVRLGFPYIFKLDDGEAIGSMTTTLTSTGTRSFSDSFPLQNTSGSSPITKTATLTPTLAGNYTVSSCHNADDERFKAPNNECQSTTITVYRYLCYQGFCFECPKEPQLSGIALDVKGAGCQAVEDIKCQTYINKSCEAGVSE